MADRVPVIAGNWKMFKTPSEGAAFVRDLTAELGAVEGREVVVAPAFTGLPAAVQAAEGTAIQVAAQNVFYDDQGAYTGEVAPGMLLDLRVGWVIIGHSERRLLFGETDDGVARKVRAALDYDLVPVMCVGETEQEREAGRTEEVLSRQVEQGVGRIESQELDLLVVAYEPVWAIGTGRTATPAMAQEAIALVRERLAAAKSADAGRTRILYGGSVKPDNIDDLMAQADIDGALVGGASLELASFARIVRFEGASAAAGR
jgi:triosephosphate isomerase (TIM)